ncbi:hypothetical protein ANCCEY_09824 [Ancylostoma ceylanicum]|uniref:Uncharacterized protein n=1 Tax=Ancylostoma ceylanicum TaxID=53326 RepID=A0A0D6LG79_9BILA|nr:hypothetical protein ANCCEY_09824 [Ancylostoma ceylanicum]
MERVRFNAGQLQNDLTGKLIQFVNAKVLRDGKITWDHLWVRDGKIIDGAAVFYDEKREADIQIDCEGHILSPGFIDIQINGEFRGFRMGVEDSVWTFPLYPHRIQNINEEWRLYRRNFSATV